MKKTLVSLVSDQTIPNLELIKEFEAEVDKYLFFHSDRTSKQADWLIQAAELDETICHKVKIDPFDVNDIQSTLQGYPFGDEDYILNITGGTKPWIIVFLEKFKDLGAEIFYVTGEPLKYLKIFPRKGLAELKLKVGITIREYLVANGFSPEPGKLHKDQAHAERMFALYMKYPTERFSNFVNFFRNHRKTKKKIPLDQLEKDYKQIIDEAAYEYNDGVLNKYDCRYLSGEWLEEWVYYNIKNELKLNDDQILCGTNLNKEGSPNEMDVMFVYKHKLYVIECKTSVSEIQEQTDGSKKMINILGETIYKSDALRSKFGLFAQSTILTLSELLDANNEPLNNFKSNFKRVQLSGIRLVSRRLLANERSFRTLLNIKDAY